MAQLVEATHSGENLVGLPKIYAFGLRKLAMKRYVGDVFSLLNSRSMSKDLKRKFFLQTTQGMTWLHSKGIVHKDIKLENMLYDQDEAVYADFDFVEFPEEAVNTITRLNSGSLPYVAPEFMKRAGWIGDDFSERVETAYKADVYSHSATWTIIFYFYDEGETSEALHEFYDLTGFRWQRNLQNLIQALQIEGDPIAALLVRGLAEDPRQRISSVDFLEEVRSIDEKRLTRKMGSLLPRFKTFFNNKFKK